ncbi:hypothetical protein PVK06_025305 [Gossypium arboreum]|uniref:Uncharacterized protein n=1 Tax=Gossypium arboreum TaxID=29729 RepID=A0ABR0PGQ9_GOSAR|nr:hypothetical protein PVK06_025305 [Gossypium arboreum]
MEKQKGKRGIHWCDWKKLCECKKDVGLGFKDLSKFNLALLAKKLPFIYLEKCLGNEEAFARRHVLEGGYGQPNKYLAKCMDSWIAESENSEYY